MEKAEEPEETPEERPERPEERPEERKEEIGRAGAEEGVAGDGLWPTPTSSYPQSHLRSRCCLTMMMAL